MSRIAAMGIPISSTNMPARERHTRQLAFNNSAVLIPERFDSSINDDSGFRDTRSGVLLQATLCENVAQKSGLNKSSSTNRGSRHVGSWNTNDSGWVAKSSQYHRSTRASVALTANMCQRRTVRRSRNSFANHAALHRTQTL